MGTSRILVVEDDARLGATLQRVLTAEGHQEVELVGDGMEAVRHARERPFDLVVLDVALQVALIVLLRKPREAFT